MNRNTPPDWMLVLLLVVGVFLWQRTVFPLWTADLFPVQYAAYEWRVGDAEWMYLMRDHQLEWFAHRQPVIDRLKAEPDPGLYYYPPVVAAALSPLADAPAVVWRNAVFFINAFLLFVFSRQILWLCRVPIGFRPFLWALALVLLAFPMARATQLGQIGPSVVAVTWAGLLAMRSDKQARAGTAIGLVGAVKLFPLAFAFGAVIERRWRTLAASLATFALIFGLSVVVAGWHIHELWWKAVRNLNSSVCPFFGNQSPLGWFARSVLGYSYLGHGFSPTPASTAMIAFGLIVFGGVTLVTLWRARANADDASFPARTGLLIAGVLLIMPVSWEHYWLFALPVLGWTIHETWTKGDRRFWEVWLAAAAFLFCMKLTRFYGDSPFGRVASGSQTMGLILFWVWLVRRVWIASGKTSRGLAIEKR